MRDVSVKCVEHDCMTLEVHLDSVTYDCSEEGRVLTQITQTGAQGIGAYLKMAQNMHSVI